MVEIDQIRMEKWFETIYDHMRSKLPPEKAATCPMLKELGDVLVIMKEGNNERIAMEIGLVKGCWDCDEC